MPKLIVSYSELTKSFKLNTTETGEQRKELLLKLRDWAQREVDKMGPWVVYYAFAQGKYAMVYYIRFDNEDKADEAYDHVESELDEKRPMIRRSDYGCVTEEEFDKLVAEDHFRNEFDIGWYRGTDTVRCESIEAMEAHIDVETSDEF